MDKVMGRLIDVVKGTQVRIISFEGGRGLRAKLNQFGLYSGDLARVVRFAPFNGPVLLEVRGMEIALGRNIAERILVEVAECDSC
jgi:Fe2+ transport system protein FeoA